MYVIKYFINSCGSDLLMRWLSLLLACQHLNSGTNLPVRGLDLAQGSRGSRISF
jgi:hypothetical protein